MNLSIYITQTLHNLSWLLLASAFVVSDASFAASKQWNFEVLLDGKKIGYHSFLVKRQNNTTVLESQAEFNVKFLFFNAYSYTHKNVETWDGSCLTSISSNTDDNGKLYSIRGKRQEDRFLVTTGNDVSTLPTCPMSFAYWNTDMLDRPQLLNSQTGEYIPVKIRKLGEESLALANESVPAMRYQVDAEQTRIELWYSQQGEWLALQSTTENGNIIHYRLTGKSPLVKQHASNSGDAS